MTGTGTASGSWPAEPSSVPAALTMVRKYLRPPVLRAVSPGTAPMRSVAA